MIELILTLKERGDGSVMAGWDSEACCTVREYEVFLHFKQVIEAAMKHRPHKPAGLGENHFLLLKDPQNLLPERLK
jgi:hypothetical protein